MRAPREPRAAPRDEGWASSGQLQTGASGPSRRRLLLGSLGLAAHAACGGGEPLIEVGGQSVPESVIDRDPVALLPSRPVLAGALDARALFASGFSAEVTAMLAVLFPLGQEAGFVPARDTERLVGAAYALQGADFCAVVTGRFDPAAVRRAADARAVTVAGAPMVRTSYAGRELYTVGNLGVVILTSRTALTGNETGMRRALDRLKLGARPGQPLARDVPAWMLEDPRGPANGTPRKEAAFVAGLELVDSPAAAAPASLPMMSGLTRGSALGNFEPPGVNVVGTLRYADERSAAQGVGTIQNLNQMTSLMSLLTTFGLGARLPPIQAQQQGSEIGFASSSDAQLVRALLNLLTATIKQNVALPPR